MTDATKTFFVRLGDRGHEPLLRSVRGTLRFDLKDRERTDHWTVSADKGNVAISRENLAADCVVRTDKTLFDGMAEGRVNLMAAVLRGAVVPEGDLELLVLFQRLFPGPPRSRQRPRASDAGRRS